MLPSPRKVVLPPCPAYPLYVAGNCYTHPGAAASGPDAVTLVLLHSSGFHKEMFEPTIEELFGVVDAASDPSGAWSGSAPRIRDVWVVECPTHGESAVLNEAAIRTAVHDESCADLRFNSSCVSQPLSVFCTQSTRRSMHERRAIF